MKLSDLSPEQAARIIERYLYRSCPKSRAAFIALIRPVIDQYDIDIKQIEESEGH